MEYGEKYGLSQTGTPPDKIPVQYAEGRARVVADMYTADALAADERIRIGLLPEGAVPFGVRMMFEALGASTTLQLQAVPVSGGDAVNLTAAVATNDAGDSDAMLLAAALEQLDEPHTLELLVAGGAITGEVKVAVSYSARA